MRPQRLTDPELRVGRADKGLAGCTVAAEGLLAGRGLAGCVATFKELPAGVGAHTLPEELWEPLLLFCEAFGLAGRKISGGYCCCLGSEFWQKSC